MMKHDFAQWITALLSTSKWIEKQCVWILSVYKSHTLGYENPEFFTDDLHRWDSTLLSSACSENASSLPARATLQEGLPSQESKGRMTRKMERSCFSPGLHTNSPLPHFSHVAGHVPACLLPPFSQVYYWKIIWSTLDSRPLPKIRFQQKMWSAHFKLHQGSLSRQLLLNSWMIYHYGRSSILHCICSI